MDSETVELKRLLRLELDLCISSVASMERIDLVRLVDSYWFLAVPPDPIEADRLEPVLNFAAGPLLSLSIGGPGGGAEVGPGVPVGLFDPVNAVLGKLVDLVQLQACLDLVRERMFVLSRIGNVYHLKVTTEDGVGIEWVEAQETIEDSQSRAQESYEFVRRSQEAMEIYRPLVEKTAMFTRYEGAAPDGPALHEKAWDFYFVRAKARVVGERFWDEFAESDPFNGVRWGTLQRLKTALHALAIMQVDVYTVCGDLRGHNLPIGAFTYGWKRERLVALLSNLTKVDLEVVKQGVEFLTQQEVAPEISLSATVAPLQPLSNGEVAISFMGCDAPAATAIVNNVMTMARRDYDKAVNGREARFARDLAHLCRSPILRVGTKPILLRLDGKVLTDIDFLLFDRLSGDLGVFQLKWQSPFGWDMTERRSKAANFVRGMDDWGARIDRWLARRSPEELVRRMCVDRNRPRVRRVFKFGIGRHFSGASGMALDAPETIALSTYSRFAGLATSTTHLDCPIERLYELVRQNGASARLPTWKSRKVEIQLGNVTVEVETLRQ